MGKTRRPGKQRVSHQPLRIAPSHTDRNGRPKQRYFSLLQARQAAAASYAINRADLEAYQCDHCKGFHIGNRRIDPRD